mmetsp:Transcript_374/g.1081  ORF Transcript_374/g.1081 Transcript_374/m.1081 type:complete len:224 (+) Transcript_374:105-776(+)
MPTFWNRPALSHASKPPRTSSYVAFASASANMAAYHVFKFGAFANASRHPKYFGNKNSMKINVGNNAASAVLFSVPAMNGPGVRVAISSSTAICFAISAIPFARAPRSIGPLYIAPCAAAMYTSCTRVAKLQHARASAVSGVNDGPDVAYLSHKYCAITSDSGNFNPPATTNVGIFSCGFSAAYSAPLMPPSNASLGLMMSTSMPFQRAINRTRAPLLLTGTS